MEIQTAKLLADYALASNFAVPTTIGGAVASGLGIYVKETGYYDIIASLNITFAAKLDDCVAVFGIDNNVYGAGYYYVEAKDSVFTTTILMSEMGVYLTAGQEIQVLTKYLTAGGTIVYSAGKQESFIQIKLIE